MNKNMFKQIGKGSLQAFTAKHHALGVLIALVFCCLWTTVSKANARYIYMSTTVLVGEKVYIETDDGNGNPATSFETQPNEGDTAYIHKDTNGKWYFCYPDKPTMNNRSIQIKIFAYFGGYYYNRESVTVTVYGRTTPHLKWPKNLYNGGSAFPNNKSLEDFTKEHPYNLYFALEDVDSVPYIEDEGNRSFNVPDSIEVTATSEGGYYINYQYDITYLGDSRLGNFWFSQSDDKEKRTYLHFKKSEEGIAKLMKEKKDLVLNAKLTVSFSGNNHYAAAEPMSIYLRIQEGSETSRWIKYDKKKEYDSKQKIDISCEGNGEYYTKSPGCTIIDERTPYQANGKVYFVADSPGTKYFNIVTRLEGGYRNVRSYPIRIKKYSQTIDWPVKDVKVLTLGDSLDVTATSSAGLDIKYETSASYARFVTHNGHTYHIVDHFDKDIEGDVTIKVSAGNDLYETVTKSKTFDVALKHQTLSWDIPSIFYVGDTIKLNAQTTSGTENRYTVLKGEDNVKWGYSNGEGYYLAMSAGDVRIKVYNDGSVEGRNPTGDFSTYLDYNPVTEYYNFTIREKSKQELTWSRQQSNMNVGDTCSLEARSSLSKPVKYEVSEGKDLIETSLVDGRLLIKALKTGAVTITASVEGDATHASASSTYSFNIYKKQEIVWRQKPTDLLIGDTAVIEAESSVSAEITYNVTDGQDKVSASVSDGKLILKALHDGNVTITAFANGNSIYNDVTESISFTIHKKSQAISWDDQKIANVEVGSLLRLQAKSSNNLPIAYKIIDGSEFGELTKQDDYYYLRGLKIGSVTVIAQSDGNDEYDKAESEKIFEVDDHLKAPVISIDGDALNITSADEGTTIYYTLDGSDPTTSSKQFTDAVQLPVSCIVKAIATKTDYNNSDIATAEYHNAQYPDIIKVGDVFSDNIINNGEENLLQYFEVTSIFPFEVTLKPRVDFEKDWDRSSVYGTVEVPASIEYNGETYNITKLGDSSLSYYTNVTSFKLNDGLREVEGSVFRCTNTESLVFPNTVTKMGMGIFSEDNQLRNIVLGRNLLEIYDLDGWPTTANYNKTCSLYSLNPTPPVIKEEDFVYEDNNNEIPAGLTLYVPIGSKTAYETAPGWKSLFGHIKEFSTLVCNAPVISTDDNTLRITADNGVNIYYTMDGSEPTKDSQLFTEPVRLSASCVIKALATVEGLTSDVTTAEYHNAQYPDIINVGDVFTANIINNGEQNFLQYFKVTSVYPFEVMLLRRQKMESNWDKSTVKGSVEVPAQTEHNGIMFNITTLDSESLKEISNITTVKFNEGLKEVRNGVLTGTASYWEPMVFPNSVEYISDGNFGYYTVVLGSGLKRIGGEAFRGSNCMTLYSLNPVPPTLDRPEDIIYTDGNIPDDFVLYVPVGAKSAYETAPGWEKLFGHIVEFDPTAIESIKADVTVSNGYWYTLSGQRLAKKPVATGVYIHNGKKVVIK